MAAPQTPRFRTDLVATPLEIEGKRFIDVTDPDSEQTFRFYEVEYSVACAMDGNRDMHGLVQWSKQELGLEPTISELETVVSTLQDLGYLDSAAAGVELGKSGASPLATPRPKPPAVPADVELGKPGASAGPSKGPPAGKVTMGWDAQPVDAKDLEALMGDDSLGPAGVAAKAAESKPKAPPAGKVTMGWDAPPVDPKELEAAMGSGQVPEPKPTLRPTTKPDADEDGPTQIPAAQPEYDDDDLSVDLSDHLSIGTEDVKEAVRQSKTMDAVQPPPELLAELDQGQDTKTGAALDEKESAAPKPAAADSSKPVELPDKPPKVAAAAEAKSAAAAPQPQKSNAGTIVLLLILIAVVGGAGAYYFLVYKKQNDGDTKPTPGETSGGAGGDTTGEPVVTSKLTEAEPSRVPVLATQAGVIASIVAAEDEVDEGAVIAEFKGVAAVERSLARPRRKLIEYTEKLEEAKAEGNDRHIERYQDKVAEKQGLVDEGEAKLEALRILAPAAGVVEPLVEAGAEVAKDDPVAEIVGERELSATFPTDESFEPGADCQIARADAPDKPVPCKVDAAGAGKVTIRISRNLGLNPGDDVVLK